MGRASFPAVALILAMSSAALAQSTSNVFDIEAAIADKNAHLSGNLPMEPAAEPGETIADAIPIPILPFTTTGFTCDNVNDYDEVCPFTGSTSPDLVYRYSPIVDEVISIDLCSSMYDTKVYVYQNTTGFLIACNDDAGCGITGYQSHISDLSLSPQNVYYIVVDGYFGDCGDYVLKVALSPCPMPCMYHVCQDESEPPCGDGYIDSFNGGCNSTPNMFSGVYRPQILGRTGTYRLNGLDHRDTDWYRLTVGPGDFSYEGLSDGFALRLSVLVGICPTSVIATTVTPDCIPSERLLWSGPGTFFLFAAPEVFQGVPCESQYRITVLGPGITGTENTSWGGIKSLYR